ncbi:MAG: sec-independent protein translocase protein TatA [Candidatus Tokpelaia sp. JSC161]|jgi:sec-independent protein translocase protein TatA|nr:MAG: sec-independent protein translocase protein TatA [Candidatus Tokpelaia sp. JSC161]
MNLFSPQHFFPILLLLLLLFGRGRISEFMGELAQGIKSFKRGLEEDVIGEDKNFSKKEEVNDPHHSKNPVSRDASSSENVS